VTGGPSYLGVWFPWPNYSLSDHTHVVDRFESGNLERAVKITEAYYELHIRSAGAELLENREIVL
jgi:hypothetical protein